MTDVQTHEFQSRVDRIINAHYKPRHVVGRDSRGAVILSKPQKENFRLMSILRSLLLLYISFTVFKAVLVQNANQNNYAHIITSLEAGDSKSQLIAYSMTPGFFTKPVGIFVADLAGQIKEAHEK
ncbi:MAG: hypothetical protein IME92_10155 [Proteobacteria bacterium]|nr:hypothetical protein [Pseudomonadota bacterium]